MLYIEHSLNLSLEYAMRSLLNLGEQSSQKDLLNISYSSPFFHSETEFALQSHTHMNYSHNEISLDTYRNFQNKNSDNIKYF